MSILRISIYGDPILKKKAKLVAGVGSGEKKLFEDMAKTMYSAKGVGLAATQVGVQKQLIVVDAGTGLLKLANPKIVTACSKKSGEEGCLSFPGVSVKVRRHNKITVEALNHDSIKVKIDADGLLARALQHEIDHLMGIMIIDRIGVAQKLLLAKKLRALKKSNKQ